MYKLVYAPDIKQSSVDYLYKDKKIHVRLNKFGHKNQIISGFEDKLSFLVTYLINDFVNKGFLTKDLIRESFVDSDNKILKEIISKFEEESRAYAVVRLAISGYMPEVSINDFKIVPLGYKRIKSSLDRLGECSGLGCLQNDFGYIPQIESFFHYFNLSCGYNVDVFEVAEKEVYKYLFDDRIYIEVTNKEFSINNEKFLKKHAVKASEDYVRLW